MVRPLLEYGNTIWGPFYKGDMNIVESVQRRATRLVTSLRHLCYEDRLKAMKLPSLSYRRKRGDMITMYKIMNGLIRINVTDLFEHTKTPYTRGHHQRVFKTHATKRQRIDAFSQRVTNTWNNLPKSVVNSPSLNTFKNQIDEFWIEKRYTTND